jgi:hypothetical protein
MACVCVFVPGCDGVCKCACVCVKRYIRVSCCYRGSSHADALVLVRCSCSARALVPVRCWCAAKACCSCAARALLVRCSCAARCSCCAALHGWILTCLCAGRPVRVDPRRPDHPCESRHNHRRPHPLHRRYRLAVALTIPQHLHVAVRVVFLVPLATQNFSEFKRKTFPESTQSLPSFGDIECRRHTPTEKIGGRKRKLCCGRTP